MRGGEECHLIRVQRKTAGIEKNGECFAFNAVSTSLAREAQYPRKDLHRKGRVFRGVLAG